MPLHDISKISPSPEVKCFILGSALFKPLPGIQLVAVMRKIGGAK